MPTPDNPLLWGLPEGLIENPNLRTQHAKTFANPDGSLTSLLSSNLHYQARPGEWEPQNHDFLVSGANHDSDRHWFRTRVSDAGIEIQDKQTEVGMRWLLPSRPTVAGNLASFTADGVSWSHRVGPRRLKFEGTVATPLGATTYTFPYEPLNAASDFTIVDGAAVSSGIQIAAPYITGANDVEYPTAGWVLLPSSRMSFAFDDTSLPAEAYPYVIDPTTTLQPGSGGFDGRIRDSNATTNYGTSTVMQLGDSDDSTSKNSRDLIEFDVSSIDSAQVVSSATLSLYEDDAGDNAGQGSWAANFHVVLADWVEAEVTWNNYKSSTAWPGSGGAGTDGTDRRAAVSATVTLDGTAANAFVAWSGATLTQNVQDLVDTSLANYGWLLVAPDAENQGSGSSYNSWRTSDHATSSSHPKLVVVHGEAFTPRAIMF